VASGLVVCIVYAKIVVGRLKKWGKNYSSLSFLIAITSSYPQRIPKYGAVAHNFFEMAGFFICYKLLQQLKL
jgi:hypothetical protein